VARQAALEALAIFARDLRPFALLAGMPFLQAIWARDISFVSGRLLATRLPWSITRALPQLRFPPDKCMELLV
jgi:hypothetical protein